MFDLPLFLNTLPDGISTTVAMLIIACKLVTVVVRPPASGSCWQWPYRVVSTIALNIGWATNRLQAGHVKNNQPPKT